MPAQNCCRKPIWIARRYRRSVGLALVLFTILRALDAVGSEPLPAPTFPDVRYGPHEQQVLDFYQAGTTPPAPLLFYIHGGGWMNGDKAKPAFLSRSLQAGISIVSINYRLIPRATAEGIKPPVKACLEDAARALQFVRSKAAEWKIDKHRVCGCGGSAGGFTALWLAFHPDLADPRSPDPVARESTRLTCVVAFEPQTSLDPDQMRAWIPNNEYGYHAFALTNYQEFLDKRTQLLPGIAHYSPYELLTRDDPPVYLFYNTPLAMGKPSNDPPHSASFGAGLVEKLKQLDVEFEFNYRGSPAPKHLDPFSFVTDKLQARGAK